MSNFSDRFYFVNSSGSIVPAATPTDIFTITGNAETNTYVTGMGFSTIQTTEGVNPWQLIKRSSANVGGTSASIAEVPFNSKGPNSESTVTVYTANPTVGTGVGNIWTGYIDSPELTPTETGDSYAGINFNFLEMYGSPIALLSANELIALNFNGNALPAGLQVLAWFSWYETYK